MIDDRRIASAAKVPRTERRDVVAHMRQALHMGLIDHGSDQGTAGGRSSPQAKVSSATTAFTMSGALSRVSNDRSPRGDPAR